MYTQGAIGPVLAIAEGHAVADLECIKQAVFMLGSLSEVLTDDILLHAHSCTH
jgi:hypothetical protein